MFTYADLKIVMEYTGCNEKRCREALHAVEGDVVNAIMYIE